MIVEQETFDFLCKLVAGLAIVICGFLIPLLVAIKSVSPKAEK